MECPYFKGKNFDINTCSFCIFFRQCNNQYLETKLDDNFPILDGKGKFENELETLMIKCSDYFKQNRIKSSNNFEEDKITKKDVKNFIGELGLIIFIDELIRKLK